MSTGITETTGPTFGGWLKQRRKDQGIGPDDFAELIGCSTITLLKVEAGERRPSRQVALLVAQLLHVPADEQEAFITFARTGQPATVSSTETTTQGKIEARSPWRATHLRKSNLPHLLTPLIGREHDEAQVGALLLNTKVRLLTLTGAPGIGKTRMALQVASDALDHFEDGVFLVELAPVSDPGEVPAAAARALSLKESVSEPVEETLLAYVRERRMLLVLDNLEHLLDATPSIVKLLEGCPWLKVLVTSREALHVRGERRYTVPPLAIPDKKEISAPTPDTLAGYPSVELFVERAQAIAPDFELTAENAGDVAAICVGLDGLPLAIELAAANAGHFSPGEMKKALAKPLRLLTGGGRDLLPRQRTLRSAIEWSYSLLTTDEQTLFRRLGVFVGGFTAPAAEALWDAAWTRTPYTINGDTDLASPMDILRSLEEKSLVKRESSTRGDGARYGLLETIREFAGEKLQKSGQVGEAHHVQMKHALYFMELAEEADSHLRGARQQEWLERLEEEHGNLLAALSWAGGHSEKGSQSNDIGEAVGAAEIGLRTAAALGHFWYVRGYFSEGRERLDGSPCSFYPVVIVSELFAVKIGGSSASSQG